MHRRAVIVIALVGVFASVLVGVRLLGGGGVIGPDDVARRPGTCELQGSDLELRAGVEDDLVVFSVHRGSTALFSEEPLRPSNHSRWCFGWDPVGRRLWFYSGDIGTSVWHIREDGSASRTPLMELTESEQLGVPLGFYDAMGSVTQKRMPPREKIAAAAR